MNSKSFDVIYQELYENIGNELDAKIKKKRKNFFKVIGIIFVLIIIMCILGNIEMIGLSIIAGCLVSIFSLFRIQELNLKYYREEIINYLVKSYGLNYDYSYGLEESEYISSKLPEKFDNFQSKDYINGIIDENIELKMSYINTYKKEICTIDGKQHVEKIETFKGIFGRVNIDKNINAEVIIDLNDLKRKYDIKRIELDSIEFEKSFDCFSNNKVIALQILTPEVLEKINKLGDIFKKYMQIRIYNNTIYYRFYLEDVFLPSKFKNVLEKNRLQKIYEVINNSVDLAKCIGESINNNF